MDSERENRKSNWSNLTLVCLIDIFSKLTFEERWTGPMLVCKSWFSACKDPSFFETLDLEPFFKDRNYTISWWSPQFEKKIDSMVRSVASWSCGGLKEIRIRHCSDEALAFAAERSPALQVISIKSSPNVTDASIFKVANHCSLLKDLDISYCHNISHESIRLIGLKCRNLTILRRNMLNWLDPSQLSGLIPSEYVNSAPQCGDEEAAVFAKFMPRLEYLEIQFSRITPKGLELIAQGCLDLAQLDLFGCANLTSRSVEHACTSMKNLKNIVKPDFYISRSVFHAERYGHWRLYDERFQTNVFQI
ncbi:hypothetical protein AMTRI_Chr12g238500 [Amborella trichopoda]|uniref:F-box domain-containing protein n=1 Tax=Amborella trichopoda TaxID=13333 RepID=W1NFE5_AMBTC|nr:F-box protein SKIP1 [Amborella trichopoda]XP_020518108.1 F-box protein SKIP1 [Amborella trichopoda]ERM93895.1 hypothetical protein AMTR_s00137p00025010 [Amborella trichopoda]|eukprot:XP_006826658.1 F-box protein SKIP1 [Amborella trichopoda]